MIPIHDRRFRIIPHAAGPQQVGADRGGQHGLTPDVAGSRSVQDLDRPILKKARHGKVIGMITVGDADGGPAPRIAKLRIQRDVVAFQRKRGGAAGDHHLAGEHFRQHGLVLSLPSAARPAACR